MPAERGTEPTRRQSTAGDKWVDRRLDKFGRLMGMRDRPDSDPFRGHAPPPAGPAPAGEPGPLAQQPAAVQPDADQATGPQQAQSQQAQSQQAPSQQAPSQQAEARVPMYMDPGQLYADPAQSYADPGQGYAEPAPHAYQAPQASAAAVGGAGQYLPGQQQAQNLAHGPYGDPGRPAAPAATPLAAAQPASTGGTLATPYAGQPAAAGLEYPYRAYASQETVPAGQAQGYTAAPEPAAPEPAAQPETQGYGTPSYAAPTYGAETYAAPAYGAQTHGAPTYGAPTYGTPTYAAQTSPAQSYGAQGPAAQSYGAQAPAPQSYGAQAPAAQTYSAQAPAAQSYSAQAPAAQSYGAQAYGARAYGTHPYAPDYSTQPYSPQAYPARQYPSPANAGPEPGPAQAYAAASYGPASYAPAGYGPPGSTGQDYGPAAATEEPAAPSWEAGAAAVASAPAAAFPAPLQDTPSAVAVAEASAEPLYRVLGGLALRDLTLVESLLEIVEQLESREEDPQQLDSLFRVDHLATRMRRNSENLLVLAGQDRESQDFEPVSLLDVARAAVSEIADYDRAQVGQLPGVQLLGVAADDITHILAELLDNAMSKSPESAEVVIRGERTGDGTLVVSVEDSGIGIPVDRLSEINIRLSRPPKVDVAVTRHMGLYVVGRLAHRHGIRVQLRERPYGGIAASVVIPSQLVGNDPDAPREIRPAEQPGGRYQPLSGAGPQAPQLSIEARGADGLRAQRAGGQESGVPFSGARSPAQQAARDADAALRAMPSAQSGIGWPAGSRQPADVAQEYAFERPAPAPAAGYRDAVPVPKFEPADPSELPKRKPGALSAVNGIPAPETPREKAPVSAAEESAIQSEADRIRSELSEFQLGQRAALSDLSGPGEQQRDYGVGTDADSGNGESLGDVRAHNEAGENDGE